MAVGIKVAYHLIPTDEVDRSGMVRGSGCVFEELRDVRVWVQRLAAQNCVLCFAVYTCIEGTRICTISLTKPFLNPFPDVFKSIENSLNAAPHESAVKDGRQLEPQSVHTSAQHKRLPLLFSQSRV